MSVLAAITLSLSEAGEPPSPFRVDRRLEHQNFYSVFENELSVHIPVIHASFAQTKLVGRMCAGNSKGLLVPMNTTDMELLAIRNSLPDSVKI